MKDEELAEWRRQDAIRIEQRRLDRQAAKEAKAAKWHEEHQAELEAARLTRAGERLARESEPEYDAHAIAMAARYKNPDGTTGIPVAEWTALMAARRKEMAALPSIAEQLATAPSVNPIPTSTSTAERATPTSTTTDRNGSGA